MNEMTDDYSEDTSITSEPKSGCVGITTQAHNSSIMAICTDSSRCGCAIYIDSSLQLVADRKDSGDPYKGLDIIIQRIDPEIVIVSTVQKRLISFLEKRFTFKVLDINKRNTKRNSRNTTSAVSSFPLSEIHLPSQHQSKNLYISQQTDRLLQLLPETQPNQHYGFEQVEGISEISDCSFTLAVVPNVWFSMSQGVQKLIDSELVKSQGFTDLEEKSLFITSRVEKSVDVCAVRAISALDNYITHASTGESDIDASLSTNNDTQSNSVQQVTNYQTQSQLTTQTIENAKNLMPILEVKYVDPGPVLSIDKFTFESLGILHGFHKNSSISEDDDCSNPDFEAIPSLYDILNQCQSPQGKRQLRTIMLWPLQEINELTHRHDTLDYFIKPENKLLRDQLTVQLKNVVPLSGLLTKLSQSVGTYKELATIYKALWSFIAVIDLIQANNGHNIEIFNRIVNLDSSDLRVTIDSIMNVVDFEASRREKRIQVCLGVDQNVDEKKEIVKNLMKFCDEVAVQETAKYKDLIGKACRVLYIPRIGFLNSIDYSSTSELLQMRSSKEFDVMLHTEQSVYFKTRRMEELDINAGDIACDLIDVQESVVIDLQSELLKHTETILRLMELCGELDCLIAFAIVSFQRGYIRPDFTLSNEEIDIRQAYHPLHCIRYNIIPNNVRFYKESAERSVKVMIITGPNSCGKTTYMKATCLVIYMAHIGCFVPALYAKIPIIDAILTRIHSANSISTGLSSFATDLHQINYALGRATEKSLIAIDEFGKGTQARDGFHLLKGLVTYFAVRSKKSPYVMIATHFNRLINHLATYSEYILYKTFKVTRDLSKDSIIYEFKMIDGVGEVSLADKVAARAGVPQNIIERANQIRDYITEGRMIRPRPPCGA